MEICRRLSIICLQNAGDGPAGSEVVRYIWMKDRLAWFHSYFGCFAIMVRSISSYQVSLVLVESWRWGSLVSSAVFVPLYILV